MEITEVRVKLCNESILKGFANVTFDHAFVVKGLKIIGRDNHLFVAMPSWRRPNGRFQDIAHPINSEMRRKIELSVLEAYESARVREAKPVSPGKQQG